MEISLVAEKLFDLGPIQVTNSLFSAFLIVLVISLCAIFFSFRINSHNPSKMQLFLEMLIGGFHSMSNDILGAVKTRQLFSFIFTFFVFILLSNWFGLLPFVSSTVIEHHVEAEHSVIEDEQKHHDDEGPALGSCLKDRDCVLTVNGVEKMEAYPIFRAPTSDVSATLALAIVSVLSVNIIGFSTLGFSYLKKYINFSGPIDFFVGILELVSEIGKLVSFTFRLFGNIFAGEVLLIVITSISYGLATVPFLALEVFVGFIQAFVFFMLTLVFMSLAVTPHEH